ncbi:MAG: cbb3-type cytochrome c oxidase subunit I [Bacteroidetes bacterium]|nr:cbb3-type cytochrome c oxidase subunit I [Bacteroidota bacterium]MBS1740413.1 cbb3-type cytochrome c oxidase subunit I [Bacteroidota bacterium]
MTKTLKFFTAFTLSLLLLTLFFGMIAAFAFLYPEFYNRYLPFYQLRPMHVSAALFWIISGAATGLLFFKKNVFGTKETKSEKAFVWIWVATILTIFGFYSLKKFGGREYWEFPPFLCFPIFIAWIFLMYSFFSGWKKSFKNPPLYVWMWATGLIFFLLTFTEQNLYQIPWFRQSFLREMTIQWKSNGAMVGAWNQMIYGTSLYIMSRLLGDGSIARSKKAYTFYFIGVVNLMINWGHHVYNLPATSFVRHLAYAVSMTEWIVFIAICIDFKNKISQARKYRYLFTHRFIMHAEFWAYLNLGLALMMSIPAINRYTHGTHITVAHAMGATIGINSMILLGSLGYILKIDRLPERNKKLLNIGFLTVAISLLVFWGALVVAGLLKGYREVWLGMTNFQQMMKPVLTTLHIFAFAGIFLFVGMFTIIWNYFVAIKYWKLGKPNMVESTTKYHVKSTMMEVE